MPHPTASLPSTTSLPFVQYDGSTPVGAGRAGGDSWAASGDWFAAAASAASGGGGGSRSTEGRGAGAPPPTSPSAQHRRQPAKRTGMERWEDHLADFHVFPRGRRQEAAMRRAAARWTALEPLLVPLRNANSLPDNHRTATQTAKATMLYHNMPAEIFDTAAAAGAAAAAAAGSRGGRRGGPRHTRERSESRTRRTSSASASAAVSTPRVGRTATTTATASPAASTRVSHPQPWSGPAAGDPLWKWRKLQDYHTPSDSSGGFRRRSVSGGGGSGGPGSRAARSKSARAAGSALHREFSRVMEGNVGTATVEEEVEHWLPQQQQQRRPQPPTSTLSVGSKGVGAAEDEDEEPEPLPDTPVGAPVVLSSAAASATPAPPPLLQMPPQAAAAAAAAAATASATSVLGGGGSVGNSSGGGGGGGGGRVADVPAGSVHSTPGTAHHQHPRRPSVPVPYPSAADTNQADPPADAPLASGPVGGVLGGSASFGSHEAATQRLQHGSSSAAGGSVGFYPQQPQPQARPQPQHQSSSKPSNPYLMQASASDASGSDLDAPIRWTT